MPLRKPSHPQIASEDSAISSSSSHPSRSASSSSSSGSSSTSSGPSSSYHRSEGSLTKAEPLGDVGAQVAMLSPQAQPSPPPSVSLKIGMVGDSSVGKTQFMLSSVAMPGAITDATSPDPTPTPTPTPTETLGSGVNFMDKTVRVGPSLVTFSIWDLGGQKETISMLPLVCTDAVVILYVFDLTRKSSLNGVKEWYRQVRGFNRDAVSLLVGTKYDLYDKMDEVEQGEVTRQVSER